MKTVAFKPSNASKALLLWGQAAGQSKGGVSGGCRPSALKKRLGISRETPVSFLISATEWPLGGPRWAAHPYLNSTHLHSSAVGRSVAQGSSHLSLLASSRALCGGGGWGWGSKIAESLRRNEVDTPKILWTDLSELAVTVVLCILQVSSFILHSHPIL